MAKMGKIVTFFSPEDPRWIAQGRCYGEKEIFDLMVMRPGIPSVVRSIRKGGRGRRALWGEGKAEATPTHILGSQTGFRFLLNRRSALNLRALLNHLIDN